MDQHKPRGVAVHAVGRGAKQTLHISNRAADSRNIHSEQAITVAARASGCHFDRLLGCGLTFTAGGGERRLHAPNYESCRGRQSGELNSMTKNGIVLNSGTGSLRDATQVEEIQVLH